MERILLSQNENNNGKDYLVIDGVLLSDQDSIVKYGRIISKTDDWEELYRDDYLEVRKNDNQLVFKSFYNDKDIVGRSIYYLYIIDASIRDYNQIIEQLKEDSLVIKRTFDVERTLELISRLEKNKNVKKKVINTFLIGVGVLALIYLLTRIK